MHFNACSTQGWCCARAAVLQMGREEGKGLDGVFFFKGAEHPHLKISRQRGSSAPLEKHPLFICQKLPLGSVAQFRLESLE